MCHEILTSKFFVFVFEPILAPGPVVHTLKQFFFYLVSILRGFFLFENKLYLFIIISVLVSIFLILTFVSLQIYMFIIYFKIVNSVLFRYFILFLLFPSNKEIATWRSLDLIETLLYMADSGLQSQVHSTLFYAGYMLASVVQMSVTDHFDPDPGIQFF